MRRRIVAGNWKLHGDHAFAHALLDAIVDGGPPEGVDLVVLPPLPYLADLAEHYGPQGIAFGAQDVSANEKGAYTGEVSARMLADVGARYGLVGHSERREYHGEGSELVARKFLAAKAAGLVPILCVGETLQHWEAGQTEFRIEAAAPGWSRDFDAWAADALSRGDVAELAAYRSKAPGMPYAHPTVEHYTPLFVTLGAASDPETPGDQVIDGYWMGLSKRSLLVA